MPLLNKQNNMSEQAKYGRETEVMCNILLVKQYGQENVFWCNKAGELGGPCDFVLDLRLSTGYKFLLEAKSASRLNEIHYRIFVSAAEMDLLKSEKSKYIFIVRFDGNNYGFIEDMHLKIKQKIVYTDSYIDYSMSRRPKKVYQLFFKRDCGVFTKVFTYFE